MIRRTPTSTLFPYTTLFRSELTDDPLVGAEGIMTTDTHPKAISARVGDATITWVAKGSGKDRLRIDRKSTRLNSSHGYSSYAVFCLKKTTRNTSAPQQADSC